MSNRPRLIELDLLRTLAILGMVVYHTVYDLQIFYGWDIDVFSGGWKSFQLMIASLFLGLVGVTAALANNRMNAGTSESDVPTGYRILKRFARIGAAAGLVTIVTYIIDPETYVRFGVLHLIAVSAVLMPTVISTFGRARRTSLPMVIAIIIIGLGIITIGLLINQLHIDNAWRVIGIPLGIRPDTFTTVDYFPLIPWFGVILIGYGIGYATYVQYPIWRAIVYRREILRLYQNMPWLHGKWITWPAHHSLFLYLIHQPLILAILWLLLGKPNL